MQLHGKDQDQYKGDDEFRHRLEEHGYNQHQRVDPGVFFQGGQDTKQDTDHGTDRHRSKCNDGGNTEPRKYFFNNRFAGSVRFTEVAVADSAYITKILYDSRVIEAQFFSLRLDLFFRRVIAEDLSGRVTGSQGLQCEDDRSHAENNRNQEK